MLLLNLTNNIGNKLFFELIYRFFMFLLFSLITYLLQSYIKFWSNILAESTLSIITSTYLNFKYIHIKFKCLNALKQINYIYTRIFIYRYTVIILLRKFPNSFTHLSEFIWGCESSEFYSTYFIDYKY